MRPNSPADGLSREIVAEASAWFVEFRSEDVPESARDRFLEWLRRSPQHIQAYLEVAGAWAEVPSRDLEGKIDIAALVARARATPDSGNVTPLHAGLGTRAASAHAASSLRTEAQSLADIESRRARSRRRFLAAASVLLVALLLGVATWFGISRHNLYATTIGEQRSIRLPDGSTVDLNARSRLKLRYSQDTRDVELLEGQALFQVAKDSRRPFIVHIGQAEVRAVGTQFDVYLKKNGAVVTVVEGRVAVKAVDAGSAGEPHSLLSAGEQVIVTPKKTVSVAKRVDAIAATAWVQKHLMFDDTPLEEVAEEFNRYNPRPLVIDDEQLRHTGISGVYSSTDPASLLGFLRDQPGIEIVETGREIRITRRGAP